MRCHICDTDTDTLFLNPNTGKFEPCTDCIEAINSAHTEFGMEIEIPTEGAPLNVNLIETPNESTIQCAEDLNVININTDI